MNSEDLKDGLLEGSMSDITKDGEPGHGEEPIEFIIQDIVEESGGGEDAGMLEDINIITTDITTGLEPGDIDTQPTEDWNKILFLVYLLLVLRLNMK